VLQLRTPSRGGSDIHFCLVTHTKYPVKPSDRHYFSDFDHMYKRHSFQNPRVFSPPPEGISKIRVYQAT